MIEIDLTNLFKVIHRINEIKQRFGWEIHQHQQEAVSKKQEVKNNIDFKDVLNRTMTRNSRLTSSYLPPTTKYDSFIEVTATSYNIDPDLIKAVIMNESSFNENAISNKGAIGLMQIMPEVAKELNIKNIYNPYENIRCGVIHLSNLIKKFNGNIELALAAYNAGEGAVRQYDGIPPYEETQNFVNKVMSMWKGQKLERK